MRLAVLGSGSGGNATLISSGDTHILIDAGFSSKQLCLRLETLGIAPSKLSAIILTHEHSDHTKGIPVFLRKYKIPLYATSLTQEALEQKISRNSADWHLFSCGQRFSIDELMIETFPIPHDAVDPIGIRINNTKEERSVGLLTDIGHVTGLVRERLRGVQSLVLEANYDPELLEEDTKRPWSIKQRISSRHGHLSNEQSRTLSEELIESGLQNIILAHLSSDCNCPKVVKKAFSRLPLKQLLVASQSEPTPWVSIDVKTELCSIGSNKAF